MSRLTNFFFDSVSSQQGERKQQLELALQTTGAGVWEWDIKTGEASFDERWANIIGYSLQELKPLSIETWRQHAHPEDLEKSNRLLKEHWEGNLDQYICESRMRHKKGHWVWVRDTGKVVEWDQDDSPRRMIGTHLDITELKNLIDILDKANKDLKDLCYVDPLTQIPNRRSYEEKLGSCIADARRSHSPLSLLMIDVDNFKAYNDHYGHEKGDQALARVSSTLSQLLPRKTDFIARYGGEELIAILPHTDTDGAATTARKFLRGIIDQNIEHAPAGFNGALTISIGIASTDHDFDNLVGHADAALYQAKRNGRNRFETHTG